MGQLFDNPFSSLKLPPQTAPKNAQTTFLSLCRAFLRRNKIISPCVASFSAEGARCPIFWRGKCPLGFFFALACRKNEFQAPKILYGLYFKCVALRFRPSKYILVTVPKSEMSQKQHVFFLPFGLWCMQGHESFRLHTGPKDLAACQISSQLDLKCGNQIEKTY